MDGSIDSTLVAFGFIAWLAEVTAKITGGPTVSEYLASLLPPIVVIVLDDEDEGGAPDACWN